MKQIRLISSNKHLTNIYIRHSTSVVPLIGTTEGCMTSTHFHPYKRGY
nr:MAG TPA: hypothetical protein [Caudoviricetes sp.]